MVFALDGDSTMTSDFDIGLFLTLSVMNFQTWFLFVCAIAGVDCLEPSDIHAARKRCHKPLQLKSQKRIGQVARVESCR